MSGQEWNDYRRPSLCPHIVCSEGEKPFKRQFKYIFVMLQWYKSKAWEHVMGQVEVRTLAWNQTDPESDSALPRWDFWQVPKLTSGMEGEE